MTKSERKPKPEARIAERARATAAIRNSDFELLSDFGIRPSDFFP